MRGRSAARHVTPQVRLPACRGKENRPVMDGIPAPSTVNINLCRTDVGSDCLLGYQKQSFQPVHQTVVQLVLVKHIRPTRGV
ncbi:hypothetical protein NPIL_245861 [Nephila pilipes]|uniref:Uncharacterized protein n=1 Tax=Nephila pilipes TaxID=299642 RepID=A0A8X6IFP5_NEPPI|nr:hypothetical protein NPIL_245861 [Nephila pilipes]